MKTMNRTADEEFVTALGTLRGVLIDPALRVYEIEAPRKLAPLAATVGVDTYETSMGRPLAESTLTVLWDNTKRHLWGTNFRIIGQLRLQIDAERGWDTVFTEAVWAGLTDNLQQANAPYLHLLGTVTRELSESFGGLELKESLFNLEMRCSWSPLTGDLKPHLEGWTRHLLQNTEIPEGIVAQSPMTGLVDGNGDRINLHHANSAPLRSRLGLHSPILGIVRTVRGAADTGSNPVIPADAFADNSDTSAAPVEPVSMTDLASETAPTSSAQAADFLPMLSPFEQSTGRRKVSSPEGVTPNSKLKIQPLAKYGQN